MDQRQRQSSFSIDEPVTDPPRQQILPTPGLSDDEAFEALAASMSLLDFPTTRDVEVVDRAGEGLGPAHDLDDSDDHSDDANIIDMPVAELREQAAYETSEVMETPAETCEPLDSKPIFESKSDPEYIPSPESKADPDSGCWQPLPAASAKPVLGDLPELLPFDGGSLIAHGSQGWLDPMALTASPGNVQPGRIEPPICDGSSAGSDIEEDLGVFQHPSAMDTDDGFHDIVMLGLLTGEISTDFIAAAPTTEGASAVLSAEGDGYDNTERWSRPTTLAELQTVVETYLQPVAAVSAGLVQRPGVLDDVVAKTFLSAWVEGREGIPSEPMESWLYSICLETVSRKDRQHQRHGAVANTRYPAPAHRGSEELRQAHARATWEVCLALGELGDLERAVLRLSHHGGLLHAEIAAQTHSSLGAVKSCLYRASNHMIDRLSHRLDGERSEAGANQGDVDSADSEAGNGADDGFDDVAGMDGRADHTWYLAGVADGSSLSALDRRVIKDIRSQLASEHVWTEPTSGIGPAIMSAAADNEGTLVIRSRGRTKAGQAGPGQSRSMPSPTGPDSSASNGTDPASPVGQPSSEAAADIGGLVRTTVQYSPAVTKEQSTSSRLRRVVHPLKGNAPDARPRRRPETHGPRNVRRSPEAATAPVPVQPAPQSQDFIADEQMGVGNRQPQLKAGAVSHGKVAALAIGVIVLAAAIILAPYVLGSGQAESESLDFELNATAADADATAVVTVSQFSSETMYRMWLGGLNPTAEQEFYAAWLVDPDTVVDGAVSMAEAQVLGSFRWTVNGEPIVLGIDVVEPRFEHLIITLQGPNDQPGPSGVVVLEGSVRSPGS